MGCHSYLCEECNEPIYSDAYTGDPVILFLVIEGKVIEKMKGQYTLYSTVFSRDKKTRLEWKNEKTRPIHNGYGDGIAAIHCRCWKGNTPTASSAMDSEQGCHPEEWYAPDVNKHGDWKFAPGNIVWFATKEGPVKVTIKSHDKWCDEYQVVRAGSPELITAHFRYLYTTKTLLKKYSKGIVCTK